MSKTNHGAVYDINHRGNLVNLKLEVLHRMKPHNYKRTKWGFQLYPYGKILIENAAMFGPAEREIRKYLGWREPSENINPVAEKQAEQLEQEASMSKLGDFFPMDLKKETFNVALSRYEGGGIAIFMPAKFAGQRFSAIYENGVFLVMRDDDGLSMSLLDTKERCVATFSIRKWFPALLNLPEFNSYRQEVDYDGESFEIKLQDWILEEMKSREKSIANVDRVLTSGPVHMPDKKMPETLPPHPPLVDKPAEPPTRTESVRDRARRYIAWLNEFSKKNGYDIKSEGGKLFLERQDRID